MPIHQLVEQAGRAISRIAGKPVRLLIEAALDALHHGLGCRDPNKQTELLYIADILRWTHLKNLLVAGPQRCNVPVSLEYCSILSIANAYCRTWRNNFLDAKR